MRLIAIAALAATACLPVESVTITSPHTQRSDALTQLAGEPCRVLYAGQSIDVGTLCLAIVGDELQLQYTTTGGWRLDEAHLWIGDDLADLPVTSSGNPQVGHFPFRSGVISGSSSYTFFVPLDTLGQGALLCETTFYAAAHAAVHSVAPGAGGSVETAWADGPPLQEQGNWATYFAFAFTCSDDPPPQLADNVCETAFALGDTTFVELGLTPARWGWQLGPLAVGSYSAELYAGAGRNDLSKGTVVGALAVDYGGASVTVSYQLDAGYTLSETHLYVGTAPITTTAPGRFGNAHAPAAAENDSYTIDGFSGEAIYVVAHAVACGPLGSE